MSERFSVECNDYHQIWKRSLSELRKETDFSDVTLVTDDKVKFSAHRILLSSCSKTLKFILKDNIHSKPLLYLSGINSVNLGFILDYMYCGEVKLYQEQLDGFLESAKKLEIEGLEGENLNLDEQHDPLEEKQNIDLHEKPEEEEIKEELTTPVPNKRGRSRGSFSAMFNAGSMTLEEVERKINELYQKINGVWSCLACEYTAKSGSNMRRHTEKHIDGLSYNCNLCDKVFNLKKNFYAHMYKGHKNKGQ